MPPNVKRVTMFDETTIVVELSDASSDDCCATEVCVVISGRLNVLPAPSGIARAPIAETTGRR